MRTIYALSALTLTVLVGCSASEVDAEGQSEDAVTSAEDSCLDGQDLDAEDVDLSNCPSLPRSPSSAMMNGQRIGLGAWELGQTASGTTYAISSISDPDADGVRNFGSYGPLKTDNIECWAKGYYRLRHMLKDPPTEYVALRAGGYQGSFFQFQTDLRNGGTGFRKISSYRDGLVKWVTLITQDGVCVQPTLSKFRDYARGELDRRGLPQPVAETPAQPEAPTQPQD